MNIHKGGASTHSTKHLKLRRDVLRALEFNQGKAQERHGCGVQGGVKTIELGGSYSSR
jgi:hypothetical protein